MAFEAFFEPQYRCSYALVIGINKYKYANPLNYAVNDAKGIAETLIARFSFSKKNVKILTDAKATKSNILKSYLEFADTDNVRENDRILFFFAGHGHTVGGRRETGFLVPVDGRIDELSSLIRWDELTRNADLVIAKHIFFLMDACYGGLAVRRKAAPTGSMRFLQDLLRRSARQVLAAGKPDQVVSDGDGTRPGHSIFTSHVLDALDGGASLSNGLITANSLMAYVYEHVGADQYSGQTPHYGSFEGDGDFVFNPSVVATEAGQKIDEGEGNEVLVQVAHLPDAETPPARSLGERIKSYIPNPVDQIKLDDLISSILRKTLGNLSPNNFPTKPTGGNVNEEFSQRVQRYDEAVIDLQITVILLAHWCDSNSAYLLEKIFSRLAEAERPQAGSTLWLSLAWYPIAAVMYAGGISALAANRYDSLRSCLLTPVRSAQPRRDEPKAIVIPAALQLTEIFGAFKLLPGMDRKYVPRSEHQLAALQPLIEDQLFLGRNYEELFDQFEIMLALVHGDINGGAVSPFWGPPGRFAYKERSAFSTDRPFSAFVNMVKAQGASWPGFKAGFFSGSLPRFEEVAEGYARLIASFSHWV